MTGHGRAEPKLSLARSSPVLPPRRLCSSGLGRSSPPRLSILSPPARPPACPYVGHASALTQRGRRGSRGSRRETLPRSGAC